MIDALMKGSKTANESEENVDIPSLKDLYQVLQKNSLIKHLYDYGVFHGLSF